MDPLPMHGRDLGVNPDDLVEAPQVEREAKQEILENKDVSSSVTKARIITGEASEISPLCTGGCPTCQHPGSWKDEGGSAWL